MDKNPQDELVISEAIAFLNKTKELGIYEEIKDLTGTFKDASKITEKYTSQEIADFIVQDSKGDLGRAYDMAREYFYRQDISLPNNAANPNWALWSEVARILREKIYQAGLVESKIKLLKEKRMAEMAEGKNLSITYPIFIVYSLSISYREANSDCGGSITLSSEFKESRSIVLNEEDGDLSIYLDDEDDMASVELNEDGDYYDKEHEVLYSRHLEELYFDKFETVCFTREAAERFITSNKHNMFEPFIYVDAIPRINLEMQEVLHLLGDKWH